MKFFSKYEGLLPELIHSPAAYGIKGKDFTFSAACRPARDGEVPESLELHLDRREIISMPATDTFTLGECRYEIYSVTVPGNKLSADCVSYMIAVPGVLTSVTRTFVMQLIDPAEIPEIPPVRVTEIYARPKGLGVTSYIEVVNPSGKETDLYEYELLVFEGTEVAGEPIRRYPLADTPQREILKPGEYAAIWGIRPGNFATETAYDTPERFIEAFCSDMLYESSGLEVSGCRIIPVKYYDEDPQTGEKVLKPGCGEIPCKFKAYTIAAVHRGDGADASFFSMTYTEVYTESDTPVRRSSCWSADPRDQTKGTLFSHREPATPGYPCEGERAVLSTTPPLILPVNPDKAVYIGDGECRVSFAVVETGIESSICSAEVEVFFSGDVSEEKFRAERTDEGTWSAIIPKELIRTTKSLEYCIKATDSINTFSCGSEEHFSLPVRDNEGPDVTWMIPEEGYAYDGTADSEISVSYFDISGVDTSRCKLTVDGRNLTSSADWNSAGMRCRLVGDNAKPGEHQLILTLTDGNGNESRRTVNFSISDMEELNVYRGQVHSHTADSDGSGTPADAYAYARDVGKVDFFAVTDHSHYITRDIYSDLVSTADKFDEPGKFAALYGWEMTWNNGSGYWGHLNVLNTPEIVRDIYTCSLPDLYAWLGEHPSAVGMFNHPGYPWGDFDEYSHRTPQADNSVCLAEIRGPFYDREYAHMLSMGWHASAVSNEDNHNPNWTTASQSDGYVLAPALTRQNVIDAFRARRTYMTTDPTMKIFYKVNGSWLGSRLNDPDKLDFDIRISTEADDGIGRIEIIAEDNIIVAVKEAGLNRSVNWKLTLNPDYDYYYVRILSVPKYCVTAPVWIENRTSPTITVIEFSSSFSDKEPLNATVRVKNELNEPLRDLRIKCFLTPSSGFREQDAEPYFTVCVGKLSPGDTARVTRQIPQVPGMRRLTAIATAKYGHRRICSTSYILTTPVTIVSVCPESKPYSAGDGSEVKNAFPYVTLYNSSPVPAVLDGGKLAPWIKTGRVPPEERTMPLDGIVIPPRGSVVLWDRHGRPLTSSDFNSFYGTDLKEGSDLFVTDVHFLSAETDSRRLDLIIAGEVVCRIYWNYALEQDKKHHPGREYRYLYKPNMTGTESPDGYGAPAPGFVTQEQELRQFSVSIKRKELKKELKAQKSDEKAEKRKSRLKLTGREGTAVAVGAAAAAASVTAAIASIFGQKKNVNKKPNKK